MLPFVCMSIIYVNKPEVKTERFNQTFGTLTEDLHKTHLLQLYYYPVFLFQRLIVAGTVVFINGFPLI